MPFNLCVFAFNARVEQLFDGISIISNTNHFIKQYSCGSGKDIDAIKTWLQVVVPRCSFQSWKKSIFLIFVSYFQL